MVISRKYLISISELEMAAHLVQFIILEYIVPLKYKSVGIFSDNTPTVSWATKLCAKNSMLAGRLLRALALRNNITKASPVVTASIPGKNNIRADNASRWFDSLFNKKYLKLTDKNLYTILIVFIPFRQAIVQNSPYRQT